MLPVGRLRYAGPGKFAEQIGEQDKEEEGAEEAEPDLAVVAEEFINNVGTDEVHRGFHEIGVFTGAHQAGRDQARPGDHDHQRQYRCCPHQNDFMSDCKIQLHTFTSQPTKVFLISKKTARYTSRPDQLPGTGKTAVS